MGHDKTPERNNIIFFYTILSVATLIVLGFIFESYFTSLTEREMETKVLSQPADELGRVRSEQLEALRTGPVPIDQAMRTVAAQGRVGSIAPEPSDDLAALEGWNEARLRPAVPGALRQEDGGEEGSDAGVADTGDGGVASEGNTGDTSPSTSGADGPRSPAEGAAEGSATPE
ncbi:MAG: hypothetical protein ACOC97_02230 [Myxococcota bacterium]